MRTTLTALAVMTALAMQADLTLVLTPGSLASQSDALAGASGKVTLKGVMVPRDFEALAVLTENVSLLDMSEIEIKGTSTRTADARGKHLNADNRIPDHAFFQNRAKEVILPKKCELGEGAFTDAYTEKVTLPPTATYIPDHTFHRSMVSTVSNTSAVRHIGKEAFTGSRVETLNFPGLAEADEFAFAGMPLLSEVTLPKNARLGRGILMDCPNLTAILGGVTILPDYFAANSSPEANVYHATTIGRYALANNGAETILLGSETRRLDEGACMGMTALRHVYASQCEDRIPDADPTAFAGVNVSSVHLHVLPGTADLWKSHEVWRDFDILESTDRVEDMMSDPTGIHFALKDGNVEIASDSPLSAVEAFDRSGFTILSHYPVGNTCRIPTENLGTEGVVLIMATNRNGNKTIKIIL